MTFDGLGRPARVSRDGIGAITYAYDPTTGLPTRKQHLDALGAVVDTSDTSYDDIGRPFAVNRSAVDAGDASALTFHYDGQLHDTTASGQLGRLTSVRGDGWERSALFDALGRAYYQRVTLTGWRDVTSDKVFRSDGSVAGGILTEDHFIELITVGGVVAGVLDNGQFAALLTDPRGTPFAGSDGAPGLASPYGARASHLRDAEVIDYAKLGWDPDLDLVRMGVRDYDPRLDQFHTPDLLYFEALDKCQASPLQCTLYGYAGGNPISFVDPTGMGFWGDVWHVSRQVAAATVDGVAMALGGIVGGGVGAVGGAPTGPGAVVTAAGGAVLGAGLARGLISPVSDLIRGERTSPERQVEAFKDGAMGEMGGQVVGKFAGPAIKYVRSWFKGTVPRPQYVPRGADGKPLPLPRGPHGELAPSSPDPHTQIGWREGGKGGYVQTREFGPNGEPVKQVDWTDHGRPEVHTDPHVHDYEPNPTGGTPQHGGARPPKPGELE